MATDRKTLLREIKSLQQLIPGEHYDMYIKQCQQKNLKYVPAQGFLPAMDENNPNSLNDVELNCLCKARSNYLNNVFIPVVAEKQPEILKGSPKESNKVAIERWSENICTAKSPRKLIELIQDVNRRKKSNSKSGKKKNKGFWQKLFGL